MKRWPLGFLLVLALSAHAESFWDGNAAVQRGDAAFEAAADGSIKAKIGVGCAVVELEDVPGVVNAATADLRASGTAAVDLTAAFGG